ncbi:MAG: thrombospondin type 3 repeat-containing protein [Verrucomicrobia bacterium]|nr:thrombospondin type 3 repeat-containing protein [Verrucomicrobiota bacterium]
MHKASGKYESIILIVMAILAITTGAWFIRMTLSFPETLTHNQGAEKPFNGDIPVDKIRQAIELAKADPKLWTQPIRGNKSVPLFKSVLLLLKFNEPNNIIDMYTESPQIRPPMTNKWLRESNLPKIGDLPAYLIPNVGDLDPDDDGFSNKEEFEKGTNPTDAKSHPPVTDKLFLVERIAHNYRLNLKSSNSPFQVGTPDESKKKNWFVSPGTRFGTGDRFIAGKLEKKMVPDDRLGEKDVSELEVEDTVRKNKFTITMGTETNIADYEAIFESRLKTLERVKAMKDEKFRIPSWPDTTYKVIDIQADSAVISPLNSAGTPDKEIIIKQH